MQVELSAKSTLASKQVCRSEELKGSDDSLSLVRTADPCHTDTLSRRPCVAFTYQVLYNDDIKHIIILKVNNRVFHTQLAPAVL